MGGPPVVMHQRESCCRDCTLPCVLSPTPLPTPLHPRPLSYLALPGAPLLPSAAPQDIVRDGRTDTIVAAGGDGTLCEVVAALVKLKAPRRLAVGLMPMGTSNDFAAVAGLPTVTAGRALPP